MFGPGLGANYVAGSVASLAGVAEREAGLASGLNYENYLGKTDATYVMETMQANTRLLAERIADCGPFGLIGDESEGVRW